MHMKISSAKRRPFNPGGDELIIPRLGQDDKWQNAFMQKLFDPGIDERFATCVYILILNRHANISIYQGNLI